jgi:hypothetical protein
LVRRWLAAVALIVGGVVALASNSAFAAGTLHVSPASGLGQKQVVRVSGSGLTPNAYGYIVECNGARGEPTVVVGPPFDQAIPVGCSPPSLKRLVSTSSSGTLWTTFQVRLSHQLGPPCGHQQIFGACEHFDSAGKHARADAQNYPCPPTPAQEASGVTCVLVLYDTAHQVVSTPITFSGEP